MKYALYIWTIQSFVNERLLFEFDIKHLQWYGKGLWFIFCWATDDLPTEINGRTLIIAGNAIDGL